MSVFEYLLSSVGAGLLQAALGVYFLLFGLGLVGQPRHADGEAEPARKRPALVVGSAVIIAFGLWLAVRGFVQ